MKKLRPKDIKMLAQEVAGSRVEPGPNPLLCPSILLPLLGELLAANQ